MNKVKVVARFLDGHTLKGVTWDFVPNKDGFHLAHAGDETKVTSVSVAELKAVFFVRSFEGDRTRKDGRVPPQFATAPGRKIRVTFLDGEAGVLRGARGPEREQRARLRSLARDPGRPVRRRRGGDAGGGPLTARAGAPAA
jgi:hypothetical protein